MKNLTTGNLNPNRVRKILIEFGLKMGKIHVTWNKNDKTAITIQTLDTRTYNVRTLADIQNIARYLY